jgi:hypothetical protein
MELNHRHPKANPPEETMFRTICRILAVAALSLALFAGCRTGRDTKVEFDKVLDAYNHMLKVNDIEMASRFIEAEKRAEFYSLIHKMLQQVSITDIQVRSVTMNKEEDEAIVVLIREYYDNATLEVRQMAITQHWKKEGESWVIIGGAF